MAEVNQVNLVPRKKMSVMEVERRANRRGLGGGELGRCGQLAVCDKVVHSVTAFVTAPV